MLAYRHFLNRHLLHLAGAATRPNRLVTTRVLSPTSVQALTPSLLSKPLTRLYSTSDTDWNAKMGAQSNGAMSDNPHDLTQINIELGRIGEDMQSKMLAPISEIMENHNRTIRNISNAVKANAWVFWERPETEKKRIVLKELKKIRDFYVTFCASQVFMDMRNVKFKSRVIASSQAVSRKIERLEAMLKALIVQYGTISSAPKKMMISN